MGVFNKVKKAAQLAIFAVLLVAISAVQAIAQDSLNITLPTVFDFTNIPAAYQTSELLVNTLVVIAIGYLSPYIPWIKNISIAARRVLVAVIPILIVIGIFGFNNDVKVLLFQI